MKELLRIRDKDELYNLYRLQISEKEIRAEINEIIAENRPNLSRDKPLFVRLLRIDEIVIFIHRNGVPFGYKLSEELQYRLDRYREELAAEKRFTLKRYKYREI
ncbi:hypothetical protein [Flavobacterium sp. CAU 1735]|uniref:hypothetical protein n=1 Tax=Flavobacterium sp. CAU 1735 TaxID=3140361 RepID=UPI0032606C88